VELGSSRAQFTAIHNNPQIRSVPEPCYLTSMVVAREAYAQLIERAFDGAVVVDGQRVVAHKSGTHFVRIAFAEAEKQRIAWERAKPLDRDNDWSDV